MLRNIIAALVLIATTGSARLASASITYSNIGTAYSQNFDTLPTDLPNNDGIQAVYSDGWRDDTNTVPGTSVSLPGWHLYHPIQQMTEGGFNDHQRLRAGPGQNTGAFWLYGANASNPEKALGSLGSVTMAGSGASMYIGLQLFNSTGIQLTSFAVTYDGEEWRDGEGAAGETLAFGYSLSATDADWFSTANFTLVPTLNFTSPDVANTSVAGVAVDGNSAGLQAGITATVVGVNWAPNTELWLRWGDLQLTGLGDDGIAVDNFSFTAVPEPSCCVLGVLAIASLPARNRSRLR